MDVSTIRRRIGWPEDGIGSIHRLLLRLPVYLYVLLLVASTISGLLIVQRIFLPNALPRIFWILDLLVVTGFWLSHLRYRVKRRN